MNTVGGWSALGCLQLTAGPEAVQSISAAIAGPSQKGHRETCTYKGEVETFSIIAMWAFCLLFSLGLGVSLASCFVFQHHVAEASDLCLHKCLRATAHLHVNVAALGGRKPLFKD